MRLTLPVAMSLVLLAGCGDSAPPEAEDVNADGSNFIEREKERASENSENLDRASEDIFGAPATESNSDDPGTETERGDGAD